MQIAQGDLEARADSTGNDAISVYAAHFNQMADRNQALLEGHRDLIRGVSHELRTPVARIRFALDLAREASAEPDRERHLATIDSDLSEVDELIQELLLVERLSAGCADLPSQTFGALAVVRDEVERLKASRPLIAVSLRSELDAEGDLTMVGNERLFRRVVRNLASNALRHARSEVRVEVTRVAASVVVRIDDDGPGIPAVERARVLEPFVRLDQSRTRELGGVGLGLTIVDRILRAAGGSLRIGDASTGGASITMSWPCDAGCD
jgi:signal transduction histidine kinase